MFAPGQRWLSDTESELGLGTVIETDERMVTLLFPATGESRRYAKQSAPLTRANFAIGDTVRSHEGWQMLVDEVIENQQQLSYSGKRLDNNETVLLKETFIDHQFELSQPDQRLLKGQFDAPKLFDLRYQCLQQQFEHQTSPLLGFVGARADLIPHQLHIARQVGQRYAPRVLLADEVGLGKTVEAALIIHQQLLSGRAKRVLIVVPSSLVHQWLVEMLRRINMAFAIFDEERCKALAEDGDNPFETEQLVLCSLDFLTHNSRYYQQALEAKWDLMVVDEAHHLSWSPGQASQEYQVVEQLAQETKGVLLLTATPDQLGHESHFARLRLLDPARFHDYSQFVAEEQQYSQLADAITPLLSGQPLTPQQQASIHNFAPDSELDLTQVHLCSDEDKQRFINHLLDRHGTGRLLFRNSRAGISGFPSRRLHPYPLKKPQEYSHLAKDEREVLYQLWPERHPDMLESWTDFDPRVPWFIELLQSLKGEKVLAICASAATAIQLADAIRVRSGIRATVFHEGMSIVERDKAANYFAQSEDGAQVLICSEIGSEGRNFQFAHHLALLDLPLNPDLLEQRIGRLDRIGQTEDIAIHLPYFEDSPQTLLMHWYHRGLQAFEHTCPTGSTVLAEVEEQLLEALEQPAEHISWQQLITDTANLHQSLKAKLEQGRDKLLELNSSGKGQVESFLADILESDQSPGLERFMTRLFDGLGILQEEKDDVSYLLRPTESMLGHLPGLDEEGMTITYERDTATQLEHVHFFSWDHPMVQHAMDMILTESTGKSAIALSQDKSQPAGSYYLELLFVLSAKAEPGLQLQRFLPPTPIYLCIDANGNTKEPAVASLQAVNQKTGQQLTKALAQPIQALLQQATQQGDSQAENIRQQRLQSMQQALGDEWLRLKHLQSVNPSVRQEEVDFIHGQIQQLQELIQNAALKLEAIRLVVNTH